MVVFVCLYVVVVLSIWFIERSFHGDCVVCGDYVCVFVVCYLGGG